MAMRSDQAFTPMSTRLFPKHQGPHAYVLTGIAARCDLVVLSDTKTPHAAEVRSKSIEQVQTIFISLRSHVHALDYFFDRVLPQLTQPFVLITGSEDVTLPNQLDKRWPAMKSDLKRRLIDLAQHPMLKRWFCENLDERFHTSVEPLPLGLVFPDHANNPQVTPPSWPESGERNRRVLCAHRVREGGQWETRRMVSELARTDWRGFTTVLNEPVDADQFEALIRAHAFVLCVEGGGLDPSPKAWQALLHGAVPIMRTGALDRAYSIFPVIMVDEWEAGSLSPVKLNTWFDKYFTSGKLKSERDDIIERLGLDYWWRRIVSHLDV